MTLATQRANKPEIKTNDHFSYPSPETMYNLRVYIEEYRPLLLNEKSGEFVFLTAKNSKGTIGAPISLNTINYIFSEISKSVGFRVHPHKLRHIWNFKFSELRKTSGFTDYEIDKARRLLMGWSATSKMTSVYNRPAEVERAQELARILQSGNL